MSCSDTSSVGNNSEQFYFGPRGELSAHDGAWQSAGSHFDLSAAEPVADDFRSHQGEGDSQTHLLQVAESDLQTAGAQYYIEAWIIAADDTNVVNGLGFRRFTPTLGGTTWAFALNTSLTNGAAINAWVDPANPPAGARNSMIDSTEGHLQLAVKTTDLGGGFYHYEYALMNLDFDRKIRAFSIPLPPSVTVQNVSFGDVDSDVGNNWAGSVLSNRVEWHTVTNSDVNALDWGTLYNFSFDANAAPTNAVGTLTISESGIGSLLPATTKGPAAVDFAGSGLFRIVSIARDGADENVTFTVVAGKNYRLERKDDLRDPGWTPLSQLTAINDGMAVLVDVGGASVAARFYRVAQLP